MQSISVQLIYQFLYLSGHLFFTFLEEETRRNEKMKEARIKKETVEVLQQASYRRTRTGK